MAHLNYTIGGNSNLVSFKSAARVPIDSLKVHFKPIQEGTGDPSPENVRPITGWTGVEARQSGKNLFQNANGNRSNLFMEKGKTYTISAKTQGSFYFVGTYPDGTNTGLIWMLNRADGRNYGSYTPSNDIVSGYMYLSSGISEAQIELGSTATSYEPYTGQTIPVEFHGKNLLKLEPYAQPSAAYKNLTDNSATVYTTTTGSGWKYVIFYISDAYSLRGKTVVFSCSATTDVGEATPRVIMALCDSNGDKIGSNIFEVTGTTISRSFTVSADAPKGSFLSLRLYCASGDSGLQEITFSNIQLELGSTATAYEPYNNTFYGGYVDIAKGELVVTHKKYVITGDETIRRGLWTPNAYSIYKYEDKDFGFLASTIDNMWCNMLKPKVSSYYGVTDGYCTTVGGEMAGYCYFIFNSDSTFGTDVETCAAKLKEMYDNGNPLYFVTQMQQRYYETYQLTPTELKTLLSTNNIWSNANDVTEVSYAVHDSAMIRAAKRRMAMAVSNPDFLPSSYRRLTGIIFGAKTYYLFNNFHLQGNDTVRISVSVNKSCNVFGCYSSGSAQDNYSLYATTSNTGKYLRYNGETYKSRWASTDQGQRYDIIITPTGSSGMPPSQDDTWEEKNFVSETELCVGTTAVSASSSKLDGIIYDNFIVDNRLCAVPVERISDGTVGYYEMYTHTFYEPIGTNPEKLGYA